MFGLTEKKKLQAVEALLTRPECGIYKRIDENRELLELLQAQAPELLQKCGWIEGCLRNQDEFLLDILAVLPIPIPAAATDMPRPWPIAAQPAGEVCAGPLSSYATEIQAELSTALYTDLLTAFEAEATRAGFAFANSSDGCALGSAQVQQLGLAVLRAKMRHVSPWRRDSDIERSLALLAADGDATAWAEGIIASLKKQGIAIVEQRTPPEEDPSECQAQGSRPRTQAFRTG